MKAESRSPNAKQAFSTSSFSTDYNSSYKNALRHALVAGNAFKDIRTSVWRELNIYSDLYNKLCFSIKLVIAEDI